MLERRNYKDASFRLMLRPDRPHSSYVSSCLLVGVQGVILVRIPLGINNPIQTTCCQRPEGALGTLAVGGGSD